MVGAASKGLDEGVAVQTGLPQNAGEGVDGQIPPVQGNHADHGRCTAIGSGVVLRSTKWLPF